MGMPVAPKPLDTAPETYGSRCRPRLLLHNLGGACLILAVIIVLAGAWYFLMGPGAGSTTAPNDVNVNVELPSVAPDAS